MMHQEHKLKSGATVKYELTMEHEGYAGASKPLDMSSILIMVTEISSEVEMLSPRVAAIA